MCPTNDSSIAIEDSGNNSGNNSDDGLDHVSVNTPLLHSNPASTEVANTASRSQTKPARKRQLRIILLLCAFAFTMMLADNLQPAALLQRFETIICDDYYSSNPSPLAFHPTSPDREPVNDCKVHPVQKELALLRGFQQFVPLFPTLVCTIPYGLLAER